MQKTLEVCVENVESALAAKEGGATRIELCADLMIGGTTPSAALLRAVKRETGLPVNAMVRPRFGDFLYTEPEFEQMTEDAAALIDAGADAIVSGCLLPDGQIDVARLEKLISMAHGRGKKFTLHRAFDVCRDPEEAVLLCRELGVDTILTSGQAQGCLNGLDCLKRVFPLAGGIEILVGGELTAPGIRQIGTEIPSARSFHLSGKRFEESRMVYRKEGVSMGLPMFSEFQLWRTDPEKIRAAREELDKL